MFQLLEEGFFAAVCDNSRYGCRTNFTVIAAAFDFGMAFRHEAGFDFGIVFQMTFPDDIFVNLQGCGIFIVGIVVRIWVGKSC